DTHCHIEQEEFDHDRNDVIERAVTSGVAMISSAITPQEWDKNLAICLANSRIFASTGLDPLLWKHKDKATDWIQKHKEDIIAIGEVGLDHYRERDHSERDGQASAFVSFITLARDLALPIQIHSRSAGKTAIKVLEENDAKLVHMHAFDGKSSLVRNASHELGYYFSIPASVVRSPQKQKMVKAVHIERILLETDSPVLGPDKGVRNEPANIILALEEVSRILNRDENEMQEIVLENTLRLYSTIQR
ncbi:MAG: TatD family hydrolase, partial [Candidatus Thorarchaeota archaeon]|nr:TatD family hydrolase [Candidatus Thorarchaeota archaeon]